MYIHTYIYMNCICIHVLVLVSTSTCVHQWPVLDWKRSGKKWLEFFDLFYDRHLLNLSDSVKKAASLDCLYSRRFAASPDCDKPHYHDPSLQRVVCGISTSCRHDSPNERRNSSNCIHAPYIKDVQALRREYASLSAQELVSTRQAACRFLLL